MTQIDLINQDTPLSAIGLAFATRVAINPDDTVSLVNEKYNIDAAGNLSPPVAAGAATFDTHGTGRLLAALQKAHEMQLQRKPPTRLFQEPHR